MPEDLKQALEGAREVELTVTGRKSGDPSTRPVWFVKEDGTLYLMPVGGSGANWYKNVVQTPRIGLAADGAEVETEATLIDDASVVSKVKSKFGEKYGDSRVTEYYPGQDVAVEVSLA
jgi:deazaflavin-dependent oxidoreductase (nitroreductase family)